MGAGKYSSRVEWLRRTKVSADGYGQPSYGYPSRGYLWAAVEEMAANRETKQESERQVTTTVVRIRGYIDVSVSDRLRILGAYYDVKTARTGDNETICEVER